MPRCPECGRLGSIHQRGCPHCGYEPENQNGAYAADNFRGAIAFDAAESRDEAADFIEDVANDQCRTPIARFQNGAEAGYFADELTHAAELDVRLLVREQFDAVHGMSVTDYVLLVREADAERASQILRSLVSSTDDHDADDASGDQAAQDGFNVAATPGGPVWVPILLTLAAGSIAYWGVEKVEQRPRPPALVNRDRRQPPDLWRVLGMSPDPWVQKLGPGQGVRRLQIAPDRRTAVVQEDRDGDGRFERQWEFSCRRDGG